ncbi:MAG TPA: phosphate acyltransferase PlsX [Terriglobia bacterium]|nr:phosphate acyltransferase PlsX [Terriglobia bacterium]HVB28584.1 phosphate acyltransferase PlsX [Terriglobia bacterium]
MRAIAVDAMGSDTAPLPEIEGAIQAVKAHHAEVILVGPQDVLRRELAQRGAAGLKIEIVNASEVVTMEDEAAKAFRRKRDSSIRVAGRLVRDGKADGLISAGNTGAVMTTAKILLGTLEGVDRPALAQVFPSSQKGKATVLLDVGANVDCKPLHLEQFAVMGEIYYRMIFGVEKPRVGLLSNGSEPHKGNEVTREVLARLNSMNLNFAGNVEGRDLFNGRVEVIVADGFIGNVALKISEGLVDTVSSLLKEALSSTFSSKMGYLLSRKAFERMKKRLDYSEYGGAPLLGVKGVCFICHGGSNANAIKNAIRVAAEFSEGRVNEKIERELALASLSRN